MRGARLDPALCGDERTALMRRDPVLRAVIERVGPCALRPRGAPYRFLVRAILRQQIAGAAPGPRARRSPRCAPRGAHGVGVWTAHMLLMFSLGRPDVLPVGDYGVRKAAQQLYRLAALPRPAELEALAAPWRPYRTVASCYLWRALDGVA